MLFALVAALSFDPFAIHKDEAWPTFAKFIQKYRGGVPYGSESETIARFAAFKATLKRIEERNAKGGARHGITKFADLTPDEFRRKHTGAHPASEKLKKRLSRRVHPSNSSAPVKSINWNEKGALTPVKDQGQCGSCWAFSASEQLESDFFLQYGKLKELAPQQLVSCDTTCLGCQGGNPIEAWGYVQAFGGQDSSASYPYTSGVTGQTGACEAVKTSRSEDVTTELGYMIADSPGDEANMRAQMMLSPMSVLVDATLWQTYEGGVITASDGCGDSIDHAVQATGYNAEKNYWIVRNSWGTNWGEGGFVYVEYGHNVCGITAQATVAAPATVAVLQPDA